MENRCFREFVCVSTFLRFEKLVVRIGLDLNEESRVLFIYIQK